MQYQTLEYERVDHIVHIRMNRPERHNAFNDLMNREFIQAFREFDEEEEAWVAIFSGKGRSFCSGADVHERQAQSQEVLRRRGGPGGGVSIIGDTLGLGHCTNWKPVIAAVHGYALGGGMDIAMQCDLVLATPDAQFEITEVNRGIGGAHLWAGAWFWGGARLANEMAILGSRLSGAEAFQRGMINRLAEPDLLLSEAEALAERILKVPPLAVRSNVRVTRYFVREMAAKAGLYPSGLKLYLSEDYQESVKARMEKREPDPFKAR